MVVSVVEGEGRVSARGKTVVVPAGAQVFIPVNSDLMASGAPSDPQPYQTSLVQPLPIDVLPEEITIAPPASDAAIQAANAEPTPEPTQSAGLPGDGAMLGGLDPTLFEGMDQALFCLYLGTAFAEAGITVEEWLAQIQQMSGVIPADSRADFEQMIQMISACQ